jgi:hypothetical protein
VTRLLAVLLIAGATLAAGCGGAETVTETVTVPQAPEGMQEPVFYAHVASVKPAGDGFELELDPAWWLTGVTAMRAKLEDTGESEVPNDYYIRDESHSLLTYRAAASVPVTVLDGDLQPLAIDVAELARLLAGENPNDRRLYSGFGDFGYWVRTDGDTVRSLDEQYQP